MRYPLITLFTFISLISIGQSNRMPGWAKNLRAPISESGRFDYFVGEGNSSIKAIVDAKKKMVASKAPTEYQGFLSILEKIAEDKLTEIVVDSVILTVVSKRMYNFPADEYHRNGRYLVLLGSPKRDINATETGGPLLKKNFVWRSVVAPGWGQFYNKEVTKGLVFSLGEVALISGTLASFSKANSASNNAVLARLSGNLARVNAFQQTQRNWETTGTILGVGAVALWILNIVDASSSQKNLFAYHHESGLYLIASVNKLGLNYRF